MKEYLELIALNAGDEGFLAVFVYSTFLTSFWIWLFAIGSLLTSIGRHDGGFRRFLDRHTLLEERPLSIMGWLLIASMTVIFGSYVGITLLISEGI